MIVDPSVLPMFFVSAFLVMIAPGADMVFIIANSVSGGKKSGVVASLGIAGGASLHFIAAALGISAVILASEFAYDVIRMLGAAYLAWVGCQYLFKKASLGAVNTAERRPSSQIFRQGIFTNLLNPKALLFNLSFVPQFVSIGHGTVWAQILVLGGMLITIGIVINLLIVLTSSRLSVLMSSKQPSFSNYFERLAGVILIGLAVFVVIARKPV